MIINVNYEVGLWGYDIQPNDDEAPSAENAYVYLTEFVTPIFLEVIRIFNKHELFSEVTVQVTWNSWCRGKIKPNKLLTISDKEGVRHFTGVSEKINTMEQLYQLMESLIVIDRSENTPECLSPYEVKVMGHGLLMNESGVIKKYPRVIQCVFRHDDRYPSLSIKTFSTAWLPCDRLCNPQETVYNYNAPRLEAALNEVDQLVPDKGEQDGGDPYSYTRFAIMKGNRLINHDDGDGLCVEVDEYGRP